MFGNVGWVREMFHVEQRTEAGRQKSGDRINNVSCKYTKQDFKCSMLVGGDWGSG